MSKQHFAKYKDASRGILKDGHTMFSSDIARELNRKSFLEEENAKLKKQLNDSANTIDELVKSGHISHHPQVELDALTDSMRSILLK